MAHKEFGPKVLGKILAKLENLVEQEREAKFEGRRFVTIIRSAKSLSKKEKEKGETKNQESSKKAIQNNPKREGS